MVDQAGHTTAASGDPLPSWNEGAAKASIVSFVRATTDAASPDYVRPEERIATFDNDGTLWAEQPYYIQFAFAIDRIKALAPRNPDWQGQEPFKSMLTGNARSVLTGDQRALVQIVAATHFGMTTDEFDAEVRKWLASACHPHTNRPYTDMVFQPMLEVLAYLRANDFKTFIVSGGGIEFIRTFSEAVYGIPPEQVIGSSMVTRYVVHDGEPVLVREAELHFFGDKEGKPVAINTHIGRRPIAAFGNSDGDFAMLEWVTSGPGARFGLIVHHDDEDREYAYDRDAGLARLARGLDEGPGRGWTIVHVKDDWDRVF